MIYAFPVTVTDVFERKIRKHLGGAGPEAIFRSDSEGWYVQFNGMVSIHLGPERPDFKIGDEVELLLRKK